MTTSKEEIVYQTCLLLVQHFRNLLNAGDVGFHSRIFEVMLHKEYDFVGIGKSASVTKDAATHPEHVVPCAWMIREVKRLIGDGNLTDAEIAKLLQKHWKVAKITKEEASRLDSKEPKGRGYKDTMPPGWRFETGKTLARLEAGEITLIPDEQENQSFS